MKAVILLIIFILGSCESEIQVDLISKVKFPITSSLCQNFDPSSSYTCSLSATTPNGQSVTWTEVSDPCNYFSVSTAGLISGTIPFGPTASCEYIVSANDGVATTTHTVNLNRSDCPSGFLEVLGNGGLGTVDFCVMRFEAKCAGSVNGDTCNDATDIPISQAANKPWRSTINAQESFDACARMSETNFPGAFRLIATPEWMTIARDIELQTGNWSSGIVGTGQIPRGHSDDPVSAIGPLAITDINDYYDSTGNSSADPVGTGWEQRRVHILSNGATIWDFAGNVWEWTDWDSGDGAVATAGPTDCTNVWQEPTTISGSITADELQSLGGYGSAQSFGQWLGSGGGDGGAIRGGAYNRETRSGMLAINLDATMVTPYVTTGFRCVYIP